MSEAQTFQLGEHPRVVFKDCSGELRIQGAGGSQVEVITRPGREGLQVQQTEEELSISSTISLTVRVPEAADTALESCSGDVRVTAVKELHVGGHRGDLMLTQVGSAELDTVNGDVDVGGSQSLRVTTLNGDLRVSAVQGELALVGVRGDILLRAVTGRAELHGITGNVRIRNPEGHVDVHDVNGNIELTGNLESGEYALETLGDIRLQLDQDSDARLELEAPVGSISCSLTLSDTQESRHSLQGILGQGTARLRVIAVSGDIKVRARRSGDVEEVLQEEIARVEEAARRAKERAQHMAEKMRRRGERLEHRSRRRAEHVSSTHTHGTRARRRHAPAEDVQQERLAVLRMLSEGKINAKQAEALLSALES
jgi:DUF4097 and DUF4098 domain-containing protein YvlB